MEGNTAVPDTGRVVVVSDGGAARRVVQLILQDDTRNTTDALSGMCAASTDVLGVAKQPDVLSSNHKHLRHLSLNPFAATTFTGLIAPHAPITPF